MAAADRKVELELRLGRLVEAKQPKPRRPQRVMYNKRGAIREYKGTLTLAGNHCKMRPYRMPWDVCQTYK